jgi:hypothetical protein
VWLTMTTCKAKHVKASGYDSRERELIEIPRSARRTSSAPGNVYENPLMSIPQPS